MENYLSNKLKSISFFLICLVVLLHSQIFNYTESRFSYTIQLLFTGQITLVAVPFYFVISGFLFAFSIKQTALFLSFKTKYIKRIKSLLIPYLIYSLICISVLALLQSIEPNFRKIEVDLTSFNFKDYLIEIFIYPHISYQLWFLRDLMILVIISPFIYFCIKYLKDIFILLLLLLNFFYWKIGFFATSSVLYFSIGFYLAIIHPSWVKYKFNNIFWISILLLWVVICFINIYYAWSFPLRGIIQNLLGIIAIWVNYDLLSNSFKNKVLSLEIIGFSFFIFLFHEPLLTVIKYSFINTIGTNNDFKSLSLYFGAPVIVIIICFLFGLCLKRFFPKAFNIMTGGR